MRTFPRRGNKVRRPRQRRGRRRERSDRAHPPLSTRFTIREMNGWRMSRLASRRLREPLNPIIKFKLNHSTAVSMVYYLPLSDTTGQEFDPHVKGFDSNRVKTEFGDSIPNINGNGFPLKRGSSSVGRASAFQAEGRGFDPRFPLHCDKRYC